MDANNILKTMDQILNISQFLMFHTKAEKKAYKKFKKLRNKAARKIGGVDNDYKPIFPEDV